MGGRSEMDRSSSYARRAARKGRSADKLNTSGHRNCNDVEEDDVPTIPSSIKISPEDKPTSAISLMEFTPEDNSEEECATNSKEGGEAGEKPEQAFANAVHAVRKKEENDRKERAKSPGKYQRERSPGRFSGRERTGSRDKSPGKYSGRARSSDRLGRRGRSPGKHSSADKSPHRRAGSKSPHRKASKSPGRRQRSRSAGKYRGRSSDARRRRGRSPGKLKENNENNSRGDNPGDQGSPERSGDEGGARTKSPSRTKSPGRYCARAKSPGKFRGLSPGKYQPRLAAEIIRRQRSKATEQVSLLLGDGPINKSKSNLNCDLSKSEHASNRRSRNNSADGLDAGTRGHSEHIPRRLARQNSNDGGLDGSRHRLSRQNSASSGLDGGSRHGVRQSSRQNSANGGLDGSSTHGRRRVPRRTRSAEFQLNSTDFKKSVPEERGSPQKGVYGSSRRSALRKEESNSSFYSQNADVEEELAFNDDQQPKSRRRPRSVEPNISSCKADEFNNEKFDPFNDDPFDVDPFAKSTEEEEQPETAGYKGRVSSRTSSSSSGQRSQRRNTGSSSRGGESSDPRTLLNRQRSRGKLSSRHHGSAAAEKPRRANSCDEFTMPKSSSSSSASKMRPPTRIRSAGSDKLESKLNYFENLNGQSNEAFHFDI